MSLSSQKLVPKPWGHEIIFAHTKVYMGKILFIRAGHKLSLQFHKVKDETIYLSKGELIFTLEQNDGSMTQYQMKTGDSFHIPPNRKHRMEAVQDCELFEVSTPEGEDVVRLEDSYGRVGDEGSTT